MQIARIKIALKVTHSAKFIKMEGRTPAKSVEQWLISLDSSLSRYANEFRSLDYCNTNSIKYFVTQEFDNFKVKPSNAHRRMILNAVAKMQTPTSRLGLDPPSPKTNGLAPDDWITRRTESTVRNKITLSLCTSRQWK